MNNVDNDLLNIINEGSSFDGAYSIRKNGEMIDINNTKNITIVTKKDKPGIDIYVRENTKNETIDIPVILTEKGLKDEVYNDFYIGKNAEVTIIAGCGIHNEFETDSEHDGIHVFHLEENSKVKYIEKHYGDGLGIGKRILNPITELYMEKNSSLEMETSQIKGVDDAVRTTKGELCENAKLIINEKIMTHDNQKAKTNFEVKLNGKNSSAKVTSRSVVTDKSKQTFISTLIGNNDCFGHVECDAIIKDKAKATSTPKIVANDNNATLIHEATIGKIAGDQLKKLMTLGLTEEQAEQIIINGFLK